MSKKVGIIGTSDDIGNIALMIAIIAVEHEHHIERDSKTPMTIIIIEKLSEDPPELSELLLGKIPIDALPFPLKMFEKQLKLSHCDAPKMRLDRNTIKNYKNNIRAKSKRLQNKKGRR